MSKRFFAAFGVGMMVLLLPTAASAMHIMEGYLSPGWCISWGIVSIPFLLVGLYSIRRTLEENPRLKILLAMAGAFVFVLSALKLPSITGSSSHPTGIGFGAILFGPAAMSVIGLIVLLFQALLLAHGGLGTLGANVFSMAIVGSFAAYVTYRIVRKFNGPQWMAVFLAAALGDLATYVTTAVQLALGIPHEMGSFYVSLMKFLSIFAITQIPLAICEGILTVIIFNTIAEYGKNEFVHLKTLTKGSIKHAEE